VRPDPAVASRYTAGAHLLHRVAARRFAIGVSRATDVALLVGATIETGTAVRPAWEALDAYSVCCVTSA